MVFPVAETDADLKWLCNYAPDRSAPSLYHERVDQLHELLFNLIAADRLPFTIGLFGGWGSGKTTFLSIMATKILERGDNPKVIYFNAWKYAGFMELVPSLIYKVLKYGNYSPIDPEKAIKEIMFSLGKEYSDTFGQWAKERIGVDPVKLIKDVNSVYSSIRDGAETVSKDVIDAYYTQIDRAQDLLARVFSNRSKITIVLIDELDRCDPDEAFSVIKQLRVFFAMRNLPIAFVVCANPEPIGLAIKHKYGLDTAFGDYEARRILEKFVDVYVDMSEPVMLDTFIKWIWKDTEKPIGDYALIAGLDDAYVQSNINVNTVLNATALQAMQTDNPLYSNLRLLRKTLERVCKRTFANSHMLWTAWHLELAQQMDPNFRREIAATSNDLATVSAEALAGVFQSPIEWQGNRLVPQANPGGTLFGLYRTKFWEACRSRLEELEEARDPESRERARVLARWMADFRRMDFLIIMSLIPIGPESKLKNKPRDLKQFSVMIEPLSNQFGYLLANY